MTTGRETMRSYSLDPAELQVRAFVSAAGAPDTFHPVMFKSRAIDYVIGIDEKTSLIAVGKDLKVPVALPVEDLYDKLYAHDFKQGVFVDLTAVTGAVAKEILAPKLTDGFNAAMDKNKPITIHAFLRKPYSNEVIRHTFSEDHILRYKADESPRPKAGEHVLLYFKRSYLPPILDVSEKGAALDMPFDDFTAALEKARAEGGGVLDLCAAFAANPKRYGFNPK